MSEKDGIGEKISVFRNACHRYLTVFAGTYDLNCPYGHLEPFVYLINIKYWRLDARVMNIELDKAMEIFNP